MKILGIIPARGGSKGIPGKNIKLLGEKPLLQYTFDSAKQSECLTKIIVSTEDEEILRVCSEIGLEAPFIRPGYLAKDKTPSIEVILHALDFFMKRDEEFDAVCLLQPTSPFRPVKLIDTAIKKFVKGNYDSLISVREVPHQFNPHWVFTENEGYLSLATGEETPIPRRQDLPRAFHRDGAIYLTKTNVIFLNHSLLGGKIGFVDTTDTDFINIDTINDWEKAESIIKRKV